MLILPFPQKTQSSWLSDIVGHRLAWAHNRTHMCGGSPFPPLPESLTGGEGCVGDGELRFGPQAGLALQPKASLTRPPP